MKKTKLQKIALFIFFGALTIALTFPSILHLPNKLIGTDGDNYQFLGFQYLGQKLFYSGNFPFGHTDLWRYPVGIDFPSSIDSYLFIMLGVGLYSFLNSPVLIYNLSVLILLFLNFLIAYFAFRQFYPKLLSIAGSIIYGSSFYVISKLGGHPNLLLTSVFPLTLSSWFYFYKTGGSRKSLVLIYISAVLLAFSSLQHVLILAGALPFLGLSLFIFYKKELTKFLKLIRETLPDLLVITVATASTIALFYTTKIKDVFSGDLQLPVKEIVSINPINIFYPNEYLKTFASVFKNNDIAAIESVVFIGIAEIILIILSVFLIQNKRLKKFLIGFSLIIFILALGTQNIFKELWPYQYLFNFFPYRGIIEPGRFYIIYFLGFTFLILELLKNIKRKSILILIIALLIFERLPNNFSFNQYLRSMDFVNAVKATDSKAVLDLPLYFDYWNGYFYDFYSAYYEKPIVAGYIHWSGDKKENKQAITFLHDLTCYNNKEISEELRWKKREAFLKYLRDNGIRTVVFHKHISYHKCEIGKKTIIYYLAHEEFEQIYDDPHSAVYYLK